VAPLASPTPRLLAGLAITLTVIALFSMYTVRQIDSLRQLQGDTIDRHRRDSLQLLRIQNNLNSLALAMRDMLEGSEPYPMTAWSAQFQRIRGDLADALEQESALAAGRSREQQDYLVSSFAQFWDGVDRMFATARSGDDAAARLLVRDSLTARLSALTSTVARLLVHNNEAEERAAQQIAGIYSRVERNVYLFLAAAIATIVFTSVYLIHSSRRLFRQISTLSSQRSELAQKLITMQEETLRSVSRELHDEFGQVLTAVGAMLRRAGKQGLPEDSPLTSELREVRQVIQETLDRVRRLSQGLHPVILEEAGLESALEWYLPQFEKQTGVKVRYERTGGATELGRRLAVNLYRVVQEALNNVARHSGASEASVRLHVEDRQLELDVEDHGSGIPESFTRNGIGMVAMRERAELLRGTISFSRPRQGGTLVRLTAPLDSEDNDA
jgi:signal transduction histidine kinase